MTTATSKVRRVSADFDKLLQDMAASINERLPPEYQISVLELTEQLSKAGLAPDITVTINMGKTPNKRGRPAIKDIMDGI